MKYYSLLRLRVYALKLTKENVSEAIDLIRQCTTPDQRVLRDLHGITISSKNCSVRFGQYLVCMPDGAFETRAEGDFQELYAEGWREKGENA